MAGTIFLTTVVLIMLGASPANASAAVADASVGGLDLLARLQALVKPPAPAVVRDMEVAAPFPQPVPELAPMPAVEDLDLASLQALVKQVKDHGGGQRSRRRSTKELPMPAEEPAHVETIQSKPQAGFPNADDVIIVFDEVEASVERALRHLTHLGASPAPSPRPKPLRDNGSGEAGSGGDDGQHGSGAADLGSGAVDLGSGAVDIGYDL